MRKFSYIKIKKFEKNETYICSIVQIFFNRQGYNIVIYN